MQQIDPSGITWDAPPEPVAPAQGSRQGGVIITDPTVAAKEARDDARLSLEQQRVNIAQNRENRQQQEFEQKQQSITPERDISDVRAELENVIDKARQAKELSNEWFATGFGAETSRDIGGTSAANVAALLDTIGSSVAFDRLSRMRAESPTGGALGNVTERELDLLKSTIASLNQSQSDEQFRRAMDDVIAAYQRVLDKIPSEDVGEPAVSAESEIQDQPSALTPDGIARTEITGEGETFLTPEDQQLQAEINAAYTGGASLEELQAISARYNRTFPVSTPEALEEARSQGRSVNVIPSGRRTAAQQALGAVADTPLGGFFVGAGNAVTAGFMDEIGEVIGLDGNTVQAAKEYLREQYPASSFAGEVAGETLSLAAGGSALKAAGAGRAAFAGAEVGQGALYGAGESNENRLGGAAIGAGATVVGQQVAQRLLEPAAQQIISRLSRETGAPPEAVQEAITDAIEGAGVRDTPLDEAAQSELGALARQAVDGGRAAKDAQAKLAAIASVNPEAKAAAERLGVELPTDLLSDDTRLMTVAGLARSQIGGDAQAAWQATAREAMERTDNALREIGASTDLASVSEGVRSRLQNNIDSLERQAAVLRDEVDEVIDVRGLADAGNLQRELANTINDLGGLAEAKAAFSAEEKRLLSMLGEGSEAKRPTYARLNKIRDQIGRAIFKNQGPWTDAPTADLKRYYAALAKDQLAHVESLGGKELADKMRGSNDLFSKMYDARGVMQSVYGKNLERDIGPLISRAVTSGAKGDGKAMRQLLDSVPEDMRGEVLLSGILSQAQRNSPGGGFSFGQYAKLYRGLRENSPIYSQIVKNIGEDGERLLRDVYSISNRMAAAENKIVRTGASNQPILNEIKAQGFLAQTIGAGKRIGTRATGALAGGAVGGPVGASAGYELSTALETAFSRGGKDRLQELHKLISSSDFKDMTEKVARDSVTDRDITRLANSKPFMGFARKLLGISTPEARRRWLASAANVGAVSQIQPNTESDSIIEVR